ncbi:MAG: class II fructose-bisphosphate aldolase, partial [Angelakisella sp.]
MGNAHGIYKGKPQLQWDLIEQIYSRVGIPLVLHGCSGIPKSDIALAAQKAVAKI